MDARFAGSQRVGDRRRRRLAVESDETLDSPVELGALSAPGGITRVADGPHAQCPREDRPDPTLPLTGLVPIAWWKYALAGLALVLVSAGIIASGWFAPQWAIAVGPGVSRLLSPPEVRAATWFSSLLLACCAQWALLIRWARSNSAKDFDGRYRMWAWTAFVWGAFSFDVATGAHLAVSETVKHFRPLTLWHADVLCWLAPAAIVGLSVLWSLRREMSGCRASRAFLYLGAVLYLMVAALRLEIDGRLTFLVRQAVVAGAALAGHVALFMSMWLHARHVLHFTADPERQARRRWRLPLPHFRIPSLGWRRRGSRVVPAEADQEPAKSRRRPRRSASPTPAGASDSDARTKDAGESSSLARARSESPKLRFDRGHESDRGIPAEEPARELAEPPVAEALIADESLPESAIDDQAEADETAEHPTFEQPNLKGLSKKQRRRLMQELRDRERAARRE